MDVKKIKEMLIPMVSKDYTAAQTGFRNGGRQMNMRSVLGLIMGGGQGSRPLADVTPHTNCAVSRSVDTKRSLSFSASWGACWEGSRSGESRCVSMVCKRLMGDLRKFGFIFLPVTYRSRSLSVGW